MTDVFASALFIAIPATITAIGSAIVAVKQSNKASAKTDQRVEEVKQIAAGNTEKLGVVHETVNGNLTALALRLEMALKENQTLRDKLARRDRKRSTDA